MLEANNISFSYKNGRSVLEDVSLSVTPGERAHVQGPSGRGKTTLCRLLCGYLPLQKGEVLVDGAPLPVRGVCPVQLVGQHPERMLDPRRRMRESLYEAAPELPDELLERLGIRPMWLDRYPHELSGGELQRFCIARALAVRPAYLVADEISTMLDAVTQAQIWSVILQEVEENNLGLVFTTHSAPLAQRIATRSVTL